MGATHPEFAHIPLVNYKGEKMSKRKLPALSPLEVSKLKACGWTDAELAARDDLNIATVAYYRELGYLPAALVNYLVRLGWSLDAESEFIPFQTVKEHFGLDRVTKAPANFDPDKLYWLQGEHMRRLPVADKVAGCVPFLRRAGLIGETLDDATREKLTAVLAPRGRANQAVLGRDLLRRTDPPGHARVRPEGRRGQAGEAGCRRPPAAVRRGAAGAGVVRPGSVAGVVRRVRGGHGIKPKDLDAPLRVAVTGASVGFGLHETMSLLGREAVLRRIDHALPMCG